VVNKNGSYPKLLWHASQHERKPGEVILPRTDFWERWGKTTLLKTIEQYRPEHCRSMADAVFCCADLSTLSHIGFDFSRYLYLVEPLDENGKSLGDKIDTLPRHDIMWHDPLAGYVRRDADFSEISKNQARAYWEGKPYPSEDNYPLWEYLLPAVKVKGILKIDKKRLRYKWKIKL